jgi:hypothetical protein
MDWVGFHWRRSWTLCFLQTKALWCSSLPVPSRSRFRLWGLRQRAGRKLTSGPPNKGYCRKGLLLVLLRAPNALDGLDALVAVGASVLIGHQRLTEPDFSHLDWHLLMHSGSAAKHSLLHAREHCSAAVMDFFSGVAFCACATDAMQSNAMIARHWVMAV